MCAWSQDAVLETINETVNKDAAKECIGFLASDEMRGRGTGTPEIDQAADYLANQFEAAGIKKMEGASSYFQPVDMRRNVAPTRINFSVGDESFNNIDDLVIVRGSNISIETDILYVGYGNESDFKNIDAKGKIIVSLAGTSEISTGDTYTPDDLRRNLLIENESGAITLSDIITFKNVQWSGLVNYLVD
jgi:hypothetical protein